MKTAKRRDSMIARAAVWLLVAALPAAVYAQADEGGSDAGGRPPARAGIHLYEVNVYSGYYSSGAPNGFEIPVQNPFVPGASSMGGVSATIGATKVREKSTLTWRYSPSYFNLFYLHGGLENHGSVNHRADIDWTHRFGKWSLSTSASGLVMNIQQLAMNPGLLGSVAAIPSTFDELAAAILAGKFTDAQLASLLTGATPQSSPEQGYLYGSRMFSAAASVGLTWAKSSRTSLSMTVVGNRTQMLGNNANAPAPQFLRNTTNVTATASLSYSLSPRTQISVSGSSSRMASTFQTGYTNNLSFSVGRTLSRRWFVQGRGGAGVVTYSGHAIAAPKSTEFLYGGNIGFKTYSHTFLVSYDHALGDIYGLGSRTNDSAMGSWAWRRPGSMWSLMADGGYQSLNSLAFPNTRSLRMSAGIGRALTPHMFVNAEYVYVELPFVVTVAGVHSTQNGVIMSVSWIPAERP